MTLLSDFSIHTLVERGELGIAPYDEQQLQPSGYDVRLGPGAKRLIPGHWLGALDPRRPLDERYTYEAFCTEREFLPGLVYLLTSVERFRFPHHVAGQLVGRSSLARMGVVIHQQAGLMDAGFEGEVTFELTVAVPTILWPGMAVGQMLFLPLDRPAARPYRGRYMGQTAATISRFHLDHAGVADA
jgi:dCTP deaminase